MRQACIFLLLFGVIITAFACSKKEDIQPSQVIPIQENKNSSPQNLPSLPQSPNAGAIETHPKLAADSMPALTTMPAALATQPAPVSW